MVTIWHFKPCVKICVPCTRPRHGCQFPRSNLSRVVSMRFRRFARERSCIRAAVFQCAFEEPARPSPDSRGNGQIKKHFIKSCRTPRLIRAHAFAKAPAAGDIVRLCSSNGVFLSTVGTTFKLFLVCGFIGWLLSTGRLSEDTAPVLSKVAFNVMLPCMLFTKVASTLTSSVHVSMLIVPLLAVFQIAVGVGGGKLAARFLDRQQAKRIGWHPLKPAKSANAIAVSTAAASGIPQAPEVLLPAAQDIPRGTIELVTACCTFGNTFTLPLVFMMSLFPAAAFDRATGYTALFLASWSPCLWSYGFQLLSSAAEPMSEEHRQGPLHSFDEADLSTAQMALSTNPDGEDLKAAEQSGQRILAFRRRLSDSKRQLQKGFNPPLLGITAGVAVGLSPAGRPLFTPSALQTLPLELRLFLGFGKLIVEMLQLLAGGSLALQSVVLAASLFQKVPEEQEAGPAPQPSRIPSQGKGAMALPPRSQAVPYRGLLPSSSSSQTPSGASAQSKALDNPVPRQQAPGFAKVGRSTSRESPSRQSQSAKMPEQNLLAMLVPRSGLEYRILAAICAVRFALVPSATWLAVSLCARLGFLPADHVCILAILIQACMPPAQNLALLVNLRPSTRFLAPRLARLLLRMYVVSVIPVTFWVTLFVSRVPVSLSVI